jgi:hypothetical protein
MCFESHSGFVQQENFNNNTHIFIDTNNNNSLLFHFFVKTNN